jgi:outer membrane protein OmpA-like peptidoglycan-associated protein
MSFNLIDAAKGLFSNELIGKATSYLGESENTVTKAISGIIPSLLGGVTEKATASHEGAQTITNLAKESDNAGFLGNLGGFFEGDSGGLMSKGAGLINSLFGEGKASMLSNVISQFSGAKSSSISSLLSMAAPAILGMLGKHVSNNNLNSDGLAAMLSSQKSNVANAIPAGLNLSSILGGFGSKTAETVSHAATTAHAETHHYATDAEENSGGGMKLLFPIILLALLGAAAWYFFKDGCRTPTDPEHTEVTHTDSMNSKSETTTAAALGKLDSLSGDFIYDMGETVTLNLPANGGSLTVGKNNTEYRLINFLNDKNAMIDTVKGNWFEFTNVRFKTGGSEITDESLTQLKNLVTIAKAFPAAQFKIGGYTDNTGDAAKNVALSQKRADAVAARLKALGMAASGLESAKGYGQEWPIADNATAEGRAQNRRVAVNVKAK